MKSSKEAINFFEHLATNAHHQVAMDELLAKQTPEIIEMYSSKSAEFVKNQFNATDYFADSIKVTEK